MQDDEVCKGLAELVQRIELHCCVGQVSQRGCRLTLLQMHSVSKGYDEIRLTGHPEVPCAGCMRLELNQDHLLAAVVSPL